MRDFCKTYLFQLWQKQATGVVRERTFRSLLEKVFYHLSSQILLINDPDRIDDAVACYILLHNGAPCGYIEFHDQSTTIGNVVETDRLQQDHLYPKNLLLTNSLDFHWYTSEDVVSVSVGKINDYTIALVTSEIDKLLDLLTNFVKHGVGEEAVRLNVWPSEIGLDQGESGLEADVEAKSKFPALDVHLEASGLFSTRVKNTLLRQGIITPRLLLMHTPELLLQDIRNLGTKGLAEIEEVLAAYGLALPETANTLVAVLYRRLAAAFTHVDHRLTLSSLTDLVNKYSQDVVWAEADVAKGVVNHPYIVKLPDGRYQLDLSHKLSEPSVLPAPLLTESEAALKLETDDGKLLLANLWQCWFMTLTERQQEILSIRYGLMGDDPATLEEAGQLQNVTRERIRQIEKKALAHLRATKLQIYLQPLANLLAEAMTQGAGLLSSTGWEHLLSERTVWRGEYTRPVILPLLCAVLEDFHYHSRFDVATASIIEVAHFDELNRVLKRILHHHRENGLPLEQLADGVCRQQPEGLPAPMTRPEFIAAAANLFDRVGPKQDGRYYYFRKKKATFYQGVDSGWAGKPGTRLQEWEERLRQLFVQISWIGQLSLSEADFQELCQAIQSEALEPNYFTKEFQGQPFLVPAAVFMTTMVFTARYATLLPDETADEFWNPYLRHVWGVTYTQAFMTRCRKRFVRVVPYLEAAFGLVFPQTSDGDVVTPIFRHALIPRYMQADFADWLRKKWRDILAVADTPSLLAEYLRKDTSLDLVYSHRLKQFITGKATGETAAALISNMAAAISLYFNDGESIESVSDLLADTPIEQEVWRQLAQVFADEQQATSAPLRLSKPRVTWVWSVDNEEMHLRVQNLIVPSGSELTGEPSRFVWTSAGKTDPFAAEIEEEVSPWRMQTGEQIVHDVLLAEPDGPLDGQLVLLTDMDETVVCLPIPSLPAADVQFFRLTQQGAYGVPLEIDQVNSGVWLVCGKRPLTFVDEDNEPVAVDAELRPPYPLNLHYTWAAQVSLDLPVSVKQESKAVVTLTKGSVQRAIAEPLLTGGKLVSSLSPQVQPTFTDTQITLTVAYGGEQLLKQASLWLRGQDGWREQWTVTSLYARGAASLTDDRLDIELESLLPDAPNLYSLEMRFSLQPAFSVPVQFAVIPGLFVEPPDLDQLYTPVHCPTVLLRGVDEEIIVPRQGMDITELPEGQQRITWTDLRHEPRLLLRFAKVEVPLAWNVPRFMAWLEPVPDKPFLTIGELRTTTLHAVGDKTSFTDFRLFIPGERYRLFPMKNGRYTGEIGKSQLYDMLQLASDQHVALKIQAGADSWTLLEVWQRPDMTRVSVEYDLKEHLLLFQTGLEESWVGKGRFVVESVTNPFAPMVELGQVSQLEEIHLLPARLPDGVYLLRLELDGTWLPLPETAVRFTVGRSPYDDWSQAQQLAEEIRSGCLITPHLAEDFVLWWAEIAEQDETDLTPQTLLQLATVPAATLENFGVNHLHRLWPSLAALKTVRNVGQWQDEHGLLPGWVLTGHPIILRTEGYGHLLKVFPISLMMGGLSGVGYGRWRLSTNEYAPKDFVYVQWHPVSDSQVHIEAGLPGKAPVGDWTKIDLLDCHALYVCTRCGRLTGARDFTLPEELIQEHLHGHPTSQLRDTTMYAIDDDCCLKAEIFPERRGSLLRDIYEEFNVIVPRAEDYLPEPILTGPDPFEQRKNQRQWIGLFREIKRLGVNNERQPLWENAARLFGEWQRQKSVSQLGQTAFALGLLLRCAAIQKTQYEKLLKDANLSERDCQDLLGLLHRIAPAHLQWALTWAELLVIHSPKGI